jgi:hypothetical protein
MIRLHLFQLKNGQYRADLAIRLADDILPDNIKDRARAVVEKCRNAADGERVESPKPGDAFK